MPKKSPPPPPGHYKVGKGRPPVSTRWKKGQSGNPPGRPKGAKNMATLFNEALNQKFSIQENGKVRKITAREGVIRRLISEALKGNIKAIALLLAKEPEIAKQVAKYPTVNRTMTVKEAMDAYMRELRGDDPD